MPMLVQAGTFSVTGSARMVTVAKVYDGDTFQTSDGEKIRLLGMNTPEVAHRDSPAQPLGNKASNILKKLLANQRVRLQFDQETKDRYGRTLAHIYLKDGTWVNAELVRLGMAHVYTFAPNWKYAKELNKIERQARQQKLGMWNHKRFRVLDAAKVSKKHIGQFRVLRGQASQIKKHKFKLGKVNISIPRKARGYMPTLSFRTGQDVVVHGKIRMSRTGSLFLSVYNPTDLEF